MSAAAQKLSWPTAISSNFSRRFNVSMIAPLKLERYFLQELEWVKTGLATMIIEWPSRANGERRAPGGAWWIWLAEIDHETSDFCNVDVDLTKGYGMGSVRISARIGGTFKLSVAPGKLHGFDAGLGAKMRLREAS